MSSVKVAEVAVSSPQPRDFEKQYLESNDPESDLSLHEEASTNAHSFIGCGLFFAFMVWGIIAGLYSIASSAPLFVRGVLAVMMLMPLALCCCFVDGGKRVDVRRIEVRKLLKQRNIQILVAAKDAESERRSKAAKKEEKEREKERRKP